jgi:hypothetical protein
MNLKALAVLPLLAMTALPTQAEQFNITTILLNSPVLNAVADTGTTVIVDGSACRSGGYMGRYVNNPEKNIDFLELCLDPHKGDYTELADTIRHEAWHVVQACMGQPMFNVVSLKESATPSLITRVVENYPAEKRHHELEAFVVAADQTNDYVVEQLNKFCFE